MAGFLHELFRYFAYLWGGITHALRLDPGVFAFVEQYPQSAWVVAGIVFLAGASTLLGQSAVLFINRVRKSRFVISLITNGLDLHHQLHRVGPHRLAGRSHPVRA